MKFDSMQNPITNLYVYGLNESIVASNYPMLTDISEAEINEKRAVKLGSAASGSGHDCFLKGIIVQFDLRLAQYMWQQVKRYHFFDFVSSQSTMHRITKMDIDSQCNEYVDVRIKDVAKEKIMCYNNGEISISEVLSNIPQGLTLTARITTNYLQLKTIYKQRKNHRLNEWQLFCKQLEELPYFLEFIGE